MNSKNESKPKLEHGILSFVVKFSLKESFKILFLRKKVEFKCVLLNQIVDGKLCIKPVTLKANFLKGDKREIVNTYEDKNSKVEYEEIKKTDSDIHRI